MLLTDVGQGSRSQALATEAEALSLTKADLHIAAFLARLAEIIDPSNGHAQVVQARCMLEADYYNAALHKLETLAEYHRDSGTALAVAGKCFLGVRKPEQAEAALRRACQADPGRQDWVADWAVALQRAKGDTPLRDALTDHLKAHPDHWQVHLALAQCLERLGDSHGAQQYYAIAARLAPDEASVHVGVADRAFRQGRAEAALAARARAIRLGGPRVMSAVALCDLPRPSWSRESVARMHAALDEARRYVPAAHGLTVLAAQLDIVSAEGDDAAISRALGTLSSADDLLEAGLFEAAQGRTPRSAMSAEDLASCVSPLLTQGLSTLVDDVDIDFRARRLLMRRILTGSPEALDAFGRWIAGVADGGPARQWCLANLAYRRGDVAGARSLYRDWVGSVQGDTAGRIMASQVSLCRLVDEMRLDGEADWLWDTWLAPDQALIRALLGAFIILESYQTKGETLAAALARQVHRLPEVVGDREDGPALWCNAILVACFLDGDDDHYDRACRLALDYFRARAPKDSAPIPASARSGRLRIGYVMTDFQHQDLPPEQYALKFHDLDRFDVTAYYFTPDATAHVRPDRPCPPTLADWPGRLTCIDQMPPDRAAAVIREDGLDLLVDAVGWWAFEIPELFLRRPAPVQVSWLGLGRPGKAGVMDYIVGTETLFPREMDDRYPEAFVRLHPIYIPPKPVPDGVPKMPRALLGLPEDAFVYLGYHQLMKVTERSLRLWLEILRRTPGSHLVLPAINPQAVEGPARQAGVGLDRLHAFRWVGSELENISRIGAADLYLDTVPFNAAGLTGSNAIAMDVPRISLGGANLYSRFGRVMLAPLGLDDLVCQSEAEYVDLAVSLHDDPQRLQDIRRRMAVARMPSPANSPGLLMRNLEAAWQHIVDRHRSGLPAVGFDVRAEEVLPA